MNIGFLSLPKFSKTPGSGPKKTRKNNIVPDTVVVRLLKNVRVMNTDFMSLPEFSKTPVSGPYKTRKTISSLILPCSSSRNMFESWILTFCRFPNPWKDRFKPLKNTEKPYRPWYYQCCLLRVYVYQIILIRSPPAPPRFILADRTILKYKGRPPCTPHHTPLLHVSRPHDPKLHRPAAM